MPRRPVRKCPACGHVIPKASRRDRRYCDGQCRMTMTRRRRLIEAALAEAAK